MNIIIIILFILFTIFILFELLCKNMGDCKLFLNMKDIKEKFLLKEGNKFILSFEIPFENTGTQQAIIVDGSVKLQPEGDKYNKLNISSLIINPELPVYPDNYLEAFLVKPGKKLYLKINIHICPKDGTPIKDEDLPEIMYFDFHYKYYGRKPIIYVRKEIKINTSDFKPIEIKIETQEEVKLKTGKPGDESFKTIPIKTHILRQTDNLSEILKKYVIPKSQPGDIIAIAESVVAILQGRGVYIEDIKPGYWATRLNRFFKQDASLSSPYSLEMAIREVGLGRIIFAFLMGIGGKIIGRSGDFYRFAGRLAATIDDPPGTMPPFDKFVVLGPKDPQKVALEVKKETALEMTIVDANDLGKVDVLASTIDDKDLIVKALKHNPQGNADEQTPIVLIRKLA